MVPLHPRHLLSIGREAREGIKVGSRDEVLDERPRGGVDETDGGDDGGCFVNCVVFENRHQKFRVGGV